MAWTVSGNIRGPQGPQGDEGPEGPQGPQGDTGAQGPTGADGAQGTAGVSLDIEGSVATYADLATLDPAPAAGQAWIVTADGLLYYYDATTGFPADGSGVPFQGPQGPTGSQGIQGVQGDPGDTGPTGDTGADGTRGSLWYTGAGVPSGITGAQANDMYLNTSNGDVYSFS